MFGNRILLICFFCCWYLIAFPANISGRVNLDQEWSPMLYISVIHSFDDLHTASYDFLRYQVEVDSTGYFKIQDIELTDGDRIYRLHICKKGDPVSTIIIGGQEENFAHFIMNKDSEITLMPIDNRIGIQHCTVEGHPAGKTIEKLFALQKKLNTPPDLPSAQNRSFIKQQVFEDLQSIADTSSSPIIRLLAFHFIQESFTNSDHLDLMEKIYNDLALQGYSSPYFEAFAKRLTFAQFQANEINSSSTPSLKWLLFLLPLAFLFFLFWKNKSTPSIAKPDKSHQKVQTLSNQEKRVFNLLKKGKTNKEISSELHIEVSTVKSHLNKIYSRLGVKSRKEIIDRE